MIDRSKVIILYASYGYTGRLIAQECKSRDQHVILAGRNLDALQKQSRETGYPFEVVDITDSAALKALLKKGAVVIHCGGPFQFTAQSMVDACLETRTHYTDITGEFPVFEMLAGYNEKGKRAGIMIMPGTGFDVVPSDCLALHLKNRLPSATHLQLAFAMSKGGLSRGTAKTTIEGLGYGSMIRSEGRLIGVPLGKKVLHVDFGSYQSKAMNIPWGDISTAWRSTGISNIEVYMGVSDKRLFWAKMSNYFNGLLRQSWMKNYLKKELEKRSDGPDEARRSSGKSFLWGKVWDNAGNEAASRIETISAYSLTAKTSVHITEKILNGNFKPGYQTPAQMYGPGLIMEIEGATRVDV